MTVHRYFLPIRTVAALGAASIALGESAAYAAEGDTPRYAPVALETRFEYDQPDRTKRIQSVLEKSAVDALRNRHGILVDEASSTKIVLHLINIDETPRSNRTSSLSDYSVLVAVYVDGKVVGDSDASCMRKGEAEVVDCAIEAIPAILKYLPERTTTDPPDGPPPPQTAKSVADDPGTKSERMAPIGPWGVIGIVVAAGGLGTSIAGAVDLGRGEVVAEQVAFDDRRDYGPRGRALLGTGLALIAVGVVAIGLDVGLRAKRRRSQTSGFQFDLHPTVAGATLRARF